MAHMLWSDPPDEPSEQFRRAQRRLRRAGWLLAVVATLALAILSGLASERHPL